VTTRGAGIAVAVFCVGISAGRAQSPTGALLLPSVERPPAALFVAATDIATPFPGELKLNGIASLIAEAAGPSAEGRIRYLTGRLMTLRNDPRFPTVIVIGSGASARDAAIAARVARADGFVAMSPAPDAAADIARLVVDVFKVADATAVKEIADFARGVSPLGRRGTRERRPDTPRRSPRTLALGTVGGSLVGIEYGQPQKRGREIWGALVPWNREWMPGADEATTLTTNVAMRIGDVSLPPGDYTFYLEPREDRVQLLVSKDVGQFHTVFDSSLVLGRVDMAMQKRPQPVEGLTFAIEPHGDGATLKLIWDDREYSATIAVVKQ